MADNYGDYLKMGHYLTETDNCRIPATQQPREVLAIHNFQILENVQECKRKSEESMYCIPAEMTELDEAKTEDNLQENFHKLGRVS